jgi:hypothetical protein
MWSRYYEWGGCFVNHILPSFENVLVVCPFIAFNCVKTFSFYNMTFSIPSSLDVKVFNFFKASQSWSFKVSSWEILSRLVILWFAYTCFHTRLGINCVTFFLSFEYLQNVDGNLWPWYSNEVILQTLMIVFPYWDLW